jgi:hypothetical protein
MSTTDSTTERKAADPFPYVLLSREQVAQRLLCEPQTVTRRFRKWGLRPVRLGQRVLFPSTQIAELEARLVESGERA